MIEYYNEDCMEGMKRYGDKHFDLCICDPPYGILKNMGNRLDKYGTKHKQWDQNRPDKTYFDELFRISHNQIIWGGNYFPELWGDGCKSFIFWYKHQPIPGWASGELAWTSFNYPAKCFDYIYYGGVNQDKDGFHPTQKPIALYKWLLYNYAKQGDLILDTHVGSASSLIACYDMGFDAVGFELDKDYYEASKKRLRDFMTQGSCLRRRTNDH